MWWTSSWLVGLWNYFSEMHQDLWGFLGSIWGLFGQWLVGFSTLSPLLQVFILAVILGCGVWFAIHNELENPLRSRVLSILRGVSATFVTPPLFVVLFTFSVEVTIGIFFYAIWMTVWVFALLFALYSYIGEAFLRTVGAVR